MSIVTTRTDASCILVVEDAHFVRSFIVGYLRDAGYLVREASSGEEAIAILHTIDPPPISVVFTDIQLGGRLTGWEVAEAFRRVHPEIPVIYTSGRFNSGKDRSQKAPSWPNPIFRRISLKPLNVRPRSFRLWHLADFLRGFASRPLSTCLIQ